MSEDLSIPNPTYRIPRHRRRMDPGTQRLAMIAGCLGATLVAMVGGWEIVGHRSSVVPVIQADNKPIRVKPDNPGGMQVAGANEDILSGGIEGSGRKLAPPPEAPAPQALGASPPPPVPATNTLTVSPPAPAAVPATPPATAMTASPSKPAVAAKPAETADKRQPAAANGAIVQLAAVKSEDAARSEWQRLEKRLPDLLSSRRPAFSKIEHDGHTLWRVRTGGFADVPQATSFCDKVRAKGAACSVADF